MKIAVDFDGTIVENKYPEIGEEQLFAFATLKEFQKQGHQLILWTYRSGGSLREAIDFCKQNGIDFYAVNKNYPEEKFDERISRKIDADVYIDDKNIGGFLGWSKIWELLGNDSFEQKQNQFQKNNSANGFFSLFKRK
jgi:hydroxymethylpyrimidine pyrophosphatase-like HAD family hydrolase